MQQKHYSCQAGYVGEGVKVDVIVDKSAIDEALKPGDVVNSVNIDFSRSKPHAAVAYINALRNDEQCIIVRLISRDAVTIVSGELT